jgi:hypothetical protein
MEKIINIQQLIEIFLAMHSAASVLTDKIKSNIKKERPSSKNTKLIISEKKGQLAKVEEKQKKMREFIEWLPKQKYPNTHETSNGILEFLLWVNASAYNKFFEVASKNKPELFPDLSKSPHITP